MVLLRWFSANAAAFFYAAPRFRLVDFAWFAFFFRCLERPLRGVRGTEKMVVKPHG